MSGLEIFIYAILGGILPALIWLFFWLREDVKNPEPRQLILKTFILGMLAVPIVLYFQIKVDLIFPNMALIAILLWVALEELMKLGSAFFGGLKSKENNEPLDPMIYMITAALGFAALENAFFVFGALLNDGVMAGIITGNNRFIGATILHVVSSGIVGICMAFSFYKKSVFLKTLFVIIGLTLAVAFHTAFNLSILYLDNYGILFAFGAVWVGVAFILLMFEKIKTIAR